MNSATSNTSPMEGFPRAQKTRLVRCFSLLSFRSTVRGLQGLWALGCISACSLQAAAAPLPAKPIRQTNLVPRALVVPKSVFVDDPEKGVDPFFPNSTRRGVKITPGVTPAPPPKNPIQELVLKGVVGTRQHRLALINGEIFAPGDEIVVKTSAGSVKVQCLKISPESVQIRVDDLPTPKTLKMPEE